MSHGILWVALGASLWGTDTPLRQPLTAVLSSAQIVFIEHLILAAVLLPVCWRTRDQWRGLGARDWAAILGISWGGSALATMAFTEAVKLGNPTTAVLLQKSQPLFAALLAAGLLNESLGKSFWASFAIAVAAAVMISLGQARGFSRPGVPAAAPGSLLALAAAALWGSSTVLGRFVLRKVSFVSLTSLRIVTAVPLLAMVAAFQPGPAAAAIGARQIVSLIALALVPGLLALLAYYRGLRRSAASRAAIAELSFPATATLLNWLVLGATISAVQVCGFLLLWIVILNLEAGNRAV